MRLYLASWQAMCQASASIAEGLGKLASATDTNSGSTYDGLAKGVSPLLDMVSENERCYINMGDKKAGAGGQGQGSG